MQWVGFYSYQLDVIADLKKHTDVIDESEANLRRLCT